MTDLWTNVRWYVVPRAATAGRPDPAKDIWDEHGDCLGCIDDERVARYIVELHNNQLKEQ